MENRFITIRDLMEYMSISKSEAYRLVKVKPYSDCVIKLSDRNFRIDKFKLDQILDGSYNA